MPMKKNERAPKLPADYVEPAVSEYEASLRILSPQRAEFVREYLLDNNGKQAVIRSGYSEKGADTRAYELLKTVAVRAAIELGKAELRKHVDYSREWVINSLVQNHQLALTGTPVVDRYGKATGQTMRSIPSSNKALELVSGLLGYTVERKAVMHMEVSALTEEQLADAEQKLEQELAKLEKS